MVAEFGRNVIMIPAGGATGANPAQAGAGAMGGMAGTAVVAEGEAATGEGALVQSQDGRPGMERRLTVALIAEVATGVVVGHVTGTMGGVTARTRIAAAAGNDATAAGMGTGTTTGGKRGEQQRPPGRVRTKTVLPVTGEENETKAGVIAVAHEATMVAAVVVVTVRRTPGLAVEGKNVAIATVTRIMNADDGRTTRRRTDTDEGTTTKTAAMTAVVSEVAADLRPGSGGSLLILMTPPWQPEGGTAMLPPTKPLPRREGAGSLVDSIKALHRTRLRWDTGLGRRRQRQRRQLRPPFREGRLAARLGQISGRS